MILMGSFLTIVLSIVAFVFILGIIIIIHELGHFIFAKRAGILCYEFSIGMGPVIYKRKKGETTFSIKAIPIGGSVSMAGEEISNEVVKIDSNIGLFLEGSKVSKLILDEKMEAPIRGKVTKIDLYGKEGNPLYIDIIDETGKECHYEVLRDAFYIFNEKQEFQIAPYDRSFESKTLLQRFLTIVAGPTMNLILAIFIYLIYWIGMGVPNYQSTVIGTVTDSYPASYYLEEGDKIISLNGTSITTWNEFSTKMTNLAYEGKTTAEIVVSRNDTNYTFEIKCATIINSCGLTDLNITVARNADLNVSGLQVGAVALNYASTPSDSEIVIQNGDIITRIYIDKSLSTSGSASFDNIIDIEEDVISWERLLSIFNDLDVANVYFDFYSQSEGKMIMYSESMTPIRTYGNELLSNQRIEKLIVMIGVSPTTHFSFTGVITNSFKSFWSDFTLIFRTLKLLIAPSGVRQVGVNNLSSIVGIFSMITQYVTLGFFPVLMFAGLISVNIGVMNLLPIPALDGGRIVFLLYELVTRKKINKKVENTINNVMFILLMVFFVYLTFNDILRIFK